MAAADYFLKIDGIDGESQDSKHKNEIEVASFSWLGTNVNAAPTSSSSGTGTGKVVAGTMDFTGSLAKDTPKLFQAMCAGTHIATAVVTARKSGDGQIDYATWKLSNVAVTRVTIGTGTASIPRVEFSLSCGKLEWEYKAQDAKGNVSTAATAGWDFSRNTKV